MAEVEITPELIQKAMASPGLLKQLQVVGDRVKERAKALAAAEGVEMEVTTVAGVRPLGRPFVNVLADNADQEFGTGKSARYRILGRAGEGG